LSKELGLKSPAVMHSFNLRMDYPGDNEYLFHWHQDSTYLLGSENAVTYWLPLTCVSRALGSIAIIPGSHKRGLYPFNISESYGGNGSLSPKDINLKDVPTSEDIYVVEAEPGDLVVFSQLLLHSSFPGNREDIRWTIQIRHSDYSNERFLNAGFPMGDATNITKVNYLPCFDGHS